MSSNITQDGWDFGGTREDQEEYIRLISYLETSFRAPAIVCILAASNQPDLVKSFIQHAITVDGGTNPLQLVQLCRASLIKAIPICGVPKVINAMSKVVDSLPQYLQDQLADSYKPPPTLSPEAYHDRGLALFNRVYGSNSQRVQDNLYKGNPLLKELAVDVMYGRILSDESLISASQTELLNIGILVTQDVPPQLRGHLAGARNVGVPQVEVDAMISLAKLFMRQRHGEGV